MKALLQSGQLEFVTGGWDQHDEACPTYQDMLLNIHRGHQFLWEQFGYHPRTAWAMETSGHSIASPRLMAEAGIEAVFILNIEPEDRQLRLKDRAMEFIWRPMYSHLARRAELLGHVFYDFYTSPLDILVEDFSPTFDPSIGHTRPGPPKKPVAPPSYQLHSENLAK